MYLYQKIIYFLLRCVPTCHIYKLLNDIYKTLPPIRDVFRLYRIESGQISIPTVKLRILILKIFSTPFSLKWEKCSIQNIFILRRNKMSVSLTESREIQRDGNMHDVWFFDLSLEEILLNKDICNGSKNPFFLY